MNSWEKLMLFACEIFALTTKTRMAGAEMCPLDQVYEPESFTCMYLVEKGHTWQEAAKRCSRNKLGPFGKGRLPRVDSKPVKDIIEKVSDSRAGITLWIGLHYTTKGYRWHQFPDEKPDPQYFMFANHGKNSEFSPYVFQISDRWNETSATQISPFICQYDVQVAKMEVTCPPPLVMETTNNKITLFGRYIYTRIDTLDWYSPDKVHPVATCTHMCVSFVAKYTAEMTSNGSKLTYYASDKRPASGTWRWTITKKKDHLGPKRTYTETCHRVDYYSPPKDMECDYIVLTNRVNVSCETKRVYPKAACHWVVMIPPGEFEAISKSSPQVYKHKSYVGNNRKVYFQTKCSALVDFEPQSDLTKITIQVRIYPKVSNDSLSLLAIAFFTTNVYVTLKEEEGDVVVYDFSPQESDQTSPLIGVICAFLILALLAAHVQRMAFVREEKKKKVLKHGTMSENDDTEEEDEEERGKREKGEEERDKGGREHERDAEYDGVE